MRLIEVKVFRFEELDAAGRRYAKDYLLSSIGYPHEDEDMHSLAGLAEHFGGRITEEVIDWFDDCGGSSVEFDVPDLDAEEIAKLVDALGSFNPATGKGHGDCKLTGYCRDEDAIDGLRIAYLAGERDLETLLQAAFETWLVAVHESAQDFYSDEQLGEFCDMNDKEFYIDGWPLHVRDRTCER